MSYSSEKVKQWRKNTKNRMVAAMGGCCQVCGYNKSTNALEFHHIDPKEKDSDGSDFLQKKRETMYKELDK